MNIDIILVSGGGRHWMMGGPLKVWVGRNNSHHRMFFV